MRPSGFWVLFFLVTFAAISKSNCVSAFINHKFVMEMDSAEDSQVISNRKLKEKSYDVSTSMKNGDLGNINQEDYPRIDPSPSSKAAINSGPIEHGTPLMPYVPRATPPTHPRHGSSP